jgi:NAD(P)-dependent dehydrogenase (short-subunit alcohol dehydrogenase family)
VAGGVAATFREPLGVVGLIVPWNFPLNISSWKLGPALACGNTVVLKPAELTPLSALRLAELVLEAGIPEGVVNVLVGKGSIVGQRLIEHPDVAKIGFTGSTEVGALVMQGAAGTIKRVTLELGGKSANVIFEDAGLEQAAASAPYAVFDNAGQDCCARSRILVQRSVYDRFLDELVEATKGVAVGDPADETTEMGPLVSAAHRETVSSFLDDSVNVAFRGDAPNGKGFWFPCTIVEASNDDRIAREEVFGPVAAVIPFEDEALGLDLDARRRSGSAGGASDRRGRPLREREHVGARADALRWVQAVGIRPRARHARARRLLRGQERVRLDGGLTMAGRLEGKVCVITGAGGGMGREAAIVFTDEGANVCAADVDEQLAEETVSLCSGPGEAFAVRANVADEGEVERMYAQTAARFGAVDVLYNNAGISPADDASVLDTSVDAWQRVQDVNTKGVFLCCKHGIPHLLERGGGSVINVASFVAILGAATSQISYTASKGAVLSMSRELAVQFARQGVRVNALCPGPVETPLLLAIFGDDPAAFARRQVHWPTGRLGKPREIVNAALFLASDESSFVNGAAFVVDGGITAAYVTPE